jgi:hypothetical protein
MTQTLMTAHLADKNGISKKQAKSALDELSELVTHQLKRVCFAWRDSAYSASASLKPAWAAIRPPASKSRFRRARGCALPRPKP